MTADRDGPTADHHDEGDGAHHDEGEIELLDREVFGRGGFIELHRCTVRHRRPDGTLSPSYCVDVACRPVFPDAVVVLAYEPQSRRVLLRRGRRPAVVLGRCGRPLRGGAALSVWQLEAVAGVLEPGDAGQQGVRARAAAELLEEAGLAVDPGSISRLGPPMFDTPGLRGEQLLFCAVEADLDALRQPAGDGSPMEEGGSAVVLPLAEALRRCEEGDIADLKTECALRRLAARLDRPR